MTSPLTEIPNVGPAIARKLFERLCTLDGRRHDPCLLDTFAAAAAVAYADGGRARRWWEFSRERRAGARG